MKRVLILAVAAVPFAAAAASSDQDDAACTKGQTELAVKAKDFRGEDMIKQLIFADLQRAKREQAEGDPEECLEAIEHAGKLLRGEY
jgi:hypothetical protein